MVKYKSDSYQLIHAGKQELICVICDKHYASKQRQEYERHVTIHKETPDIPCSTCGKLFRSEGYLKIHEKSHGDASFKCHICSLECVTNISLNKHKETHMETDSTSCSICDKKFLSLVNLRNHQRNIHLQENYTFCCPICPKKFRRQGNRNKHAKTTHGKCISFECHACKQNFPTRQNLSIHMTCHSDQRPNLPCLECGKLFSSQHILQSHIRYMHRFATTKCDICSGVFKVTTIRGHLKTHAQKDIPNIVCEICFRKCKTRNLKKHMKSHEFQNLKCDQCEYRCTENVTLLSHIRSHKKDPIQSCEYCTKTFRKALYLRKHVKEVHTHAQKKKYVVCMICNTACQNNSILQNHIKKVHYDERPHSCTKCTKKFKRKDHLKGHLILHSDDKPFKCEICSDSFANGRTLQIHRYIHTNEKPYKCESCGEGFRQPHHLKSHNRSRHSNQKKELCNVCQKPVSKLNMHMRNHSSKVHYTCEYCEMGFKFQASFVRHTEKEHGTKTNKCEKCQKVFGCSNDLKRHFTRIHTKGLDEQGRIHSMNSH